MNSIFWAGLAIGFILNLIATQCWEMFSRYRAWKTARKLVGTWVAYNIQGRVIDATPMPGAGMTIVSSSRSWFSANSGVLDVRAEDITNTSTGSIREHGGHIVFDPSIPWLATRIDRYGDSGELVQQRLVISQHYDLVHVFPTSELATLGNVYGKHAWRRRSF